MKKTPNKINSKEQKAAAGNWVSRPTPNKRIPGFRPRWKKPNTRHLGNTKKPNLSLLDGRALFV